MSRLLKLYEDARRARENAEYWQNLPNGKCYQNDSFFISLPHCKPAILTRCGQKSAGGTNYWETGKEFNLAITEYIVNNWDDIYPGVIKIMKTKEVKALKNCQQFIDEMQEKISSAES